MRTNLPKDFWRIHIWHSFSWRQTCPRWTWPPARERQVRGPLSISLWAETGKSDEQLNCWLFTKTPVPIITCPSMERTPASDDKCVNVLMCAFGMISSSARLPLGAELKISAEKQRSRNEKRVCLEDWNCPLSHSLPQRGSSFYLVSNMVSSQQALDGSSSMRLSQPGHYTCRQ